MGGVTILKLAAFREHGLGNWGIDTEKKNVTVQFWPTLNDWDNGQRF